MKCSTADLFPQSLPQHALASPNRDQAQTSKLQFTWVHDSAKHIIQFCIRKTTGRTDLLQRPNEKHYRKYVFFSHPPQAFRQAGPIPPRGAGVMITHPRNHMNLSKKGLLAPWVTSWALVFHLCVIKCEHASHNIACYVQGSQHLRG